MELSSEKQFSNQWGTHGGLNGRLNSGHFNTRLDTLITRSRTQRQRYVRDIESSPLRH